MVVACNHSCLGEVGHCLNWYVRPYEETFERYMVSSEFLIYWKRMSSLCYEENEGFAQMRLEKYAYVIIENAMSVFWQCAYSRLECHIGIRSLLDWADRLDMAEMGDHLLMYLRDLWCVFASFGRVFMRIMCWCKQWLMDPKWLMAVSTWPFQKQRVWFQ